MNWNIVETLWQITTAWVALLVTISLTFALFCGLKNMHKEWWLK